MRILPVKFQEISRNFKISLDWKMKNYYTIVKDNWNHQAEQSLLELEN